MSRAGLLPLLLLANCTAPSRAHEAAAVRTAIDAGRVGCLVAQAKNVDITEAQREWCAR